MGRARRFLSIALLAALVVAGLPELAQPAAARTSEGSAAGTPHTATTAVVPTEAPRIIVRFDSAAGESARYSAIASVGGRIDAWLAADDVRITLPVDAADVSGDGAGLAVLKLSGHPAVASAQLDARASLSFTPNDTLYLTDPQFGVGQWGIRQAQVDKAWDVVRGSPSLIVAVVDTGIDANHPDLAGVALPGATFVSAADPSCPPGSTVDDNGHGTHVAGLIAANGNNGQGIAGVAFGVRILPVKALDCQGAGLLSDVSRGIVWAADHGARIINISLGSDAELFTMHDAVRYAVAHGALVVAAAGNCGVASSRCPSVNAPSYPAAYAEAFAVGSTDTADNHSTFSNIGSYVAISAPGEKIWSTTPTYPTTISRTTPGTQTYAAVRGTSQASPFAAGVAALVLSKEPSLTVQQVIDRLKSTADDLGAVGQDPVYGAGRVNALRAVTSTTRYAVSYDASALPQKGTISAPLIGPVKLTNLSSFTWAAGGLNPVRLGYHWTDQAGKVVIWDGQRSVLPNDVPLGASVTVTATIATPKTPGTYVLQLDLVQEGVAWFSTNGAPTANRTVSITSGLAASYAPTASAQSTFVLGPNAFGVSVTNTGTVTWSAAGANPVHLGYHWLAPDGTVVVWDGARGNLPADLAPGQAAVVALPVASPPATGTYVLELDLVQEGVAWFSSQGVVPRDLTINVTTGFGASFTLGSAVPALLPGGRALVPVTLRNEGLLTWSAAGTNPVHLAAHLFDADGAVVLWDGERTNLPADVPPGQTVTAMVAIASPSAPGLYSVRIDLVREGVAWFSSFGVTTANVTLQDQADYRAAYTLATPTTISRANPTVTVTVTNTGGTTWTSGGTAPLDLSSHWLAADGTALAWDGPRAAITGPVAPGASVRVTLALAPPPAGAVSLVVDLVAEGLRWFGAGSPQQVALVP